MGRLYHTRLQRVNPSVVVISNIGSIESVVFLTYIKKVAESAMGHAGGALDVIYTAHGPIHIQRFPDRKKNMQIARILIKAATCLKNNSCVKCQQEISRIKSLLA